MKNIVLVCFSLVLAFSVNAQKIGYLNSIQLLDSLPEVKKIAKELVEYTGGIEKAGAGMIDTFQMNVRSYQRAVSEGTISKIDQQKLASALEAQQQEIIAFENAAKEAVDKKRVELMQPILDKVNAEIKKYAEANGYAMIFEASSSLLFYQQADNVFDALLALLKK